jgi:hypothetical protein
LVFEPLDIPGTVAAMRPRDPGKPNLLIFPIRFFFLLVNFKPQTK